MIYFDDDTVKIGGVILPGIYKSIEIEHEAKIDEQTVEGSSSKPKQATGFDDAKINIELLLIDSEAATKEDKLQVIQDLFKAEGQGKPQVHELISSHTAIRGAKQVIIKKVVSKETNKKDEITVTIELLQYDAMKITAAVSGKSKKKGASSNNTSNLSEDYKKYLNDGRGLAPRTQNKIAMSPAQTERWKQQYDRG
ncbi:MAG: transcriptional regulator [Lachnospiraceae bacterium]|nr:transcriptional regulator [Lachnospiraceae bacterium]